MTSETKEHLCEICGDVGFPDEIRICSRCKISREHSYCRRPLSETPEVWLCEKCEVGTTASPKSVQPSVPEGPQRRKYVKPSKTKFLNPIDAMMLSSGTKKSSFSSRRGVPTTSGPYRGLQSNLTTTTVKPKAPTQMPSPLNLGRDSDLRRPGPSIPACVGASTVAANREALIGPSKGLRGDISKESNVAQPPRSEHNSGKEIRSPSRNDKRPRMEAPCSSSQPVHRPPVTSSRSNMPESNVAQPPRSEHNSGKEIRSPSRNDKRPRMEAPCSSSQPVHRPPITSSRSNMPGVDAIQSTGLCGKEKERHALPSAGIEPRKSGAANGEPVNALPKENGVEGPAHESSWKGNFKVPGTANLRELNVAIEARTPDNVLTKLLEFSKKMPEVLHFELLPRPEVWTGTFPDYVPDNNDVGLYLFSTSSQRSGNYVRLLEFMEASDSVLITRVKDVQLLVFTSKYLSADCQTWGGEYYLWGIFRSVKKKKAAEQPRQKLSPPPEQPREKLSPPEQPPSLAHQTGEEQPPSVAHRNGETNREDTSCDMEIDMMGGREVGVPDLPIPRESPKTQVSVPQMQPPPPVLITQNFPTPPPVFTYFPNQPPRPRPPVRNLNFPTQLSLRSPNFLTQPPQLHPGFRSPNFPTHPPGFRNPIFLTQPPQPPLGLRNPNFPTQQPPQRPHVFRNPTQPPQHPPGVRNPTQPPQNPPGIRNPTQPPQNPPGFRNPTQQPQPPPVLRNCNIPTQPPVLPGGRNQSFEDSPPGFEGVKRPPGFNQQQR